MAKTQNNAVPDNAAPVKKKSNKLLYAIIGAAVIGLIYFVATQKAYGTIKYGICQVFIEKTLSYPTEFRVASAYEKPNEVRMEYTTTNEYGEYILKTVVCVFKPDPVNGWALTEVQVNRNKLPDEMIDSFNPTIPSIIANPPDLALPYVPSDNLMDLQR